MGITNGPKMGHLVPKKWCVSTKSGSIYTFLDPYLHPIYSGD